ncbi:MAG TPA: hypothetical protein EYP85_11775 [Armatimonadetes bacterium]|nr:hypothetical protein [Armatimonadota bacterium]
MWPWLMFSGLLMAVGGEPTPELRPNLLLNGGFERLGGWQLPPTGRLDRTQAHSGAASVRMENGGAVQQTLFGLLPGQRYSVSAWLKTENVVPSPPGGYAFLAVYQHAADGSLLAFEDFAQVTGTRDWQRFTHTFTVVPQAESVIFKAGIFNAEGVAWCDDYTLVAGARPYDWSEVEAGFQPSPQAPTRIAIFRQPDLPVVGAAAEPETLAQWLRQAGYEVDFLDAQALAETRVLRPDRYPLLILPYGASFPLAARLTFLAYLRAGGSFFNLGGYAFDHLLVREKGRWRPWSEVFAAQLKAVRQGENSLLPNPSFEEPLTPETWQRSAEEWCTVAEDTAHRGRRSLQVHLPPEAGIQSAQWFHDRSVQPGETYLFRGWAKTEEVRGPGFAYLAVYQYGPEGRLVAWRDVVHLQGTQDWQACEYTFTLQRGVTRLSVRMGLYRASGRAWFDDLVLAPAPRDVRLNAHFGTPRDGLAIAPTQLPVFDPAYPLKRVHYLAAPPNIRREGAVQGYAALATVGQEARWIPVLEARDRYGRRRGAAVALVHHYGGMYAGSSWGLAGVDDVNLFAAGEELMRQVFLNLVTHLLRKCYLTSVTTNYACYRPGEPVEITTRLANFGPQTQQVRIVVEATPDPPLWEAKATLARPSTASALQTVYRAEREVTVEPGWVAEATVTWAQPTFTSDFYRVRARLFPASDQPSPAPWDIFDTGFVVREERILRAGPPLRYHDNYFHFGDRPQFLFGTDTYSNLFHSVTENPLTWAQELQQAQDFGLHVYENLQYRPSDYRFTEAQWRQLDGLIQLAQKYQQVYMAGLLIGHNVVVSAAELAQQREFCRAFAERYREVPGLIYYLNGDFRLQMDNAPPDIQRLYHEFLRERYGTEESLREAWSQNPPEEKWEQLPPRLPRTMGWTDGRAFDYRQFLLFLTRRWVQALCGSIRATGASQPLTAEYYSRPFGGLDVRRTIDGLDIGNIGYFDLPHRDLEMFPAVFKFIDQRISGKSLNVGEFGVKTHEAWKPEYGGHGYHLYRTEAEQQELFLGLAHYALGLGGSKIQNWCWKDARETIFPWGLNYPDLVPKDVLYTYRNLSLLFQPWEVVYEPPPVWFLIPTNHRLGAGGDRVRDALYLALRRLLAAHVNFGVLSEPELSLLPEAAQVLLYPLPYCPDEATYEAVKQFVRRGGRLYVSGDLSYDVQRRPTRQERLRELCGVEIVGVEEGEVPRVRVRATTARSLAGEGREAGEVQVFVHRYGAGRVFYTPEPWELYLAERPEEENLYRDFLGWAGVCPIGVSPDEPWLHVFTLPTRKGETLTVLFNADERGPQQEVILTDLNPPLTLTVAARRPALVVVGPDGELRAGEAQGSIRRGGQVLATATAHFALFSLDGRDLSQAAALLLLPFAPGTITLLWAWPEVEAEVGEIRAGRWETLEPLPLSRREGKMQLRLDEDQATGIVLLCRSGEQERRRQQVAGFFARR